MYTCIYENIHVCTHNNIHTCITLSTVYLHRDVFLFNNDINLCHLLAFQLPTCRSTVVKLINKVLLYHKCLNIIINLFNTLKEGAIL